MPPVSLLDLVGRGADGLRTAGRRAVRSAAMVALDEVTLAPFRARRRSGLVIARTTCVTAKNEGRPVLMDAPVPHPGSTSP